MKRFAIKDVEKTGHLPKNISLYLLAWLLSLVIWTHGGLCADADAPAFLVVKSNVHHANILVEGILFGHAFETLKVSPGRLNIEVAAEGYSKKAIAVDVKSGNTKTVTINLAKPKRTASAQRSQKKKDGWKMASSLPKGGQSGARYPSKGNVPPGGTVTPPPPIIALIALPMAPQPAMSYAPPASRYGGMAAGGQPESVAGMPYTPTYAPPSGYVPRFQDAATPDYYKTVVKIDPRTGQQILAH